MKVRLFFFQLTKEYELQAGEATPTPSNIQYWKLHVQQMPYFPMKIIQIFILLSDLKLNDWFIKGDGLYIAINSKGKLGHKYTYFPNWHHIHRNVNIPGDGPGPPTK